MRPCKFGVIRDFNTKNFLVRIEAEEEFDVDLSFDETGRTRRGLERGTLIAFTVKASVTCKETGEEIATDYLGNCIYKSIEDFEDHIECGKQNRKWAKKGEEGRCGSYFSDMVATVCEDAREEIAKRAKFYSNLEVRS